MFAPFLARLERKRISGGVAGFLAVVVVLWTLNWRSNLPRHPDLAVAVEEAQDVGAAPANPGHLGPQVCAKCHAERVSEFRETRHFMATCIPEPGRMPDGFRAERGAYVVPDLPLRFEMTESKGEFVQTALRKTESGEQKSSSAIAFIYGARGGNDEVYFAWHDDRLSELPMVWVAPLETWGASSFDHHGSGDFSREMTIRCVECHNTWVGHVPGSRNQYRRDEMVLGVTCEVCHGPGREHVDFHVRSPHSKEPYAVVRPATLPRERLMDLCAQCHSNALKHRGPAFRYRPGEPLDDYYYTLKTKHPEDDHVANQTTYLRQSKCFQKSETLTCVTCHNPHRPRSAANAGAESCRQCHQPADCADRERLPVAVRDDCVGCHMPQGRKIQVFFQTEEDRYVAPVPKYEHRIAVYPDARSEVLLRWHLAQTDLANREEAGRLSKLLAKLRREESDSRQREFRYLAAIDACRESLKFDPDPDARQKLVELIAIQSGVDANLQDGLWHLGERHHEQAIEALQRVLTAKPDHPMANAKLGTSYAVVGQMELAVKHLQAAAEYDGDDPYPTAMLGWLAYLDGRAEEALEYYRRADAVEPYSAKISHQMGLAYIRLGRFTEAAERLTKAITVDPKATSSMVALSQTLRRQGKPDEALRYGLQAAKVSRAKEPDILINLADCYAELGKWPEAIQTAEIALKVIPPQQTQVASQVRLRLLELRNRAKSGR